MSNLSRLDHHNWRKCSSKVYDWSKCTTTRRRQRRGCFIAWYYLAMDCYTVSKIRQILGSLWLSITSSIFWLDNKNQTMYHLGEWTGQRRKRRTDTDGLRARKSLVTWLAVFWRRSLITIHSNFVDASTTNTTTIRNYFITLMSSQYKGRGGRAALDHYWKNGHVFVLRCNRKKSTYVRKKGSVTHNRHEWIAYLRLNILRFLL